MKELRALVERNRAGSGEAMVSVCSAHPDVIAASALLARDRGAPLLIEATSNQVNQFGGYTGMTPADFIGFVKAELAAVGAGDMPVLFGGDHLGPQVWRSEPAESAMAKARDLIAAFVAAGFTKIHLDCSEGCAKEPAQVADAVSAARAAELCAVAEATADDKDTLSYIYGTEVPPPGGARAGEEPEAPHPTTPESAEATIAAHRAAFLARGLEAAWPRAVGLVVQPGLEFAPDHVFAFDRAAPDRLSPVLQAHPHLAFEAHSTDYQSDATFPELGRRHFAVLKVGPALTFAWREGLYALDALAGFLAGRAREPLPEVMERLMLAEPGNWRKHYSGTPDTERLLRHFSYADRIRYYWGRPEARAAQAALMDALGDKRPADMVLRQFFPEPILEAARRLETPVIPWPRALLFAKVQAALGGYYG